MEVLIRVNRRDVHKLTQGGDSIGDRILIDNSVSEYEFDNAREFFVINRIKRLIEQDVTVYECSFLAHIS